MNIEKHKLDLIDGVCLFDGRAIHSYPSPRDEEKRTVTIGLLNDEFVAKVWTGRETGIRLISLRRARDMSKKENIVRYTAKEVAQMLDKGERAS